MTNLYEKFEKLKTIILYYNYDQINQYIDFLNFVKSN